VLVASEVLTNRSAIALNGLNLILVKKLIKGGQPNNVLLKFLFVGCDHLDESVQKIFHAFYNNHELIYLESARVDFLLLKSPLDIEISFHRLK